MLLDDSFIKLVNYGQACCSRRFVGDAYMRPLTRDFWRSCKWDFEDSTCIGLPARSPALRDEGRGIFDQPHREGVFDKLQEREQAVTLCNPELVFAEILMFFGFLLTLTLTLTLAL